MPGLREHRDRLVRLRDEARARRTAIIERAEREGRDRLTESETTAHRALTEDITALDEMVGEASAECRRAGLDNDDAMRVRQASGRLDANGGGTWEARAAAALQRLGGEENATHTRAMTSGSVDVPQLLPVGVTPQARPVRLVDLLVNRIQLQGNAFEYFVHSVRTNNAAVVADNATKPTSVNTIEPVIDRARVLAHLSEPTPQRLLMDVPGLEAWLWSEMAEGVIDALEAEVISGDGTSEHFTGVLSASGTTPVAFATDAPTTIRKGLTAAQNAGDVCNALVLNPADAETLDLTRWGASGGFLLDGFADGQHRSANVFGDPAEITRVICPSVPAGTALLADWTKVLIGVRETLRIDVDMSGTLFTKNQFVARAEGRYGIGITRPASFYVCALAAE
ncbi:MAG: phage major capsid protein [Mycobacterium sp.]